MARLRQRKPVNYDENHSGAAQHEEPETYEQPLPAATHTFPVVMQQQSQPPPFMSQQYFPPPQQVVPEVPHMLNMQMSQQSQTQTSTTIPIIPNNIDVKTKFPVARIKRIMQADEDVGKVAQATPTAVCKR